MKVIHKPKSNPALIKINQTPKGASHPILKDSKYFRKPPKRGRKKK